MKTLLKKQKVMIDGHQRGSRVVTDWTDSSQDIHLDKTSKEYRIKGKPSTVRIKIPLNSDRAISYSVNGKRESSVSPKLIEEISNALGNLETRQPFLDDLIDTLDKFDTTLDSEKKAVETLERIAKHFDLDWRRDKITTYVNDKIKALTLVYKDINNELYFISLNKDGIQLGEIDAWTRHGIGVNQIN